MINAKRIALIFLFSLMLGKVFADTKKRIDSLNALPHEFIVSNIYKAIKIYTDAAEQAEKINYAAGAASAYAQLGKSYYLNGKHDSSTVNYLKAFRIFEKIGDDMKLADAYGEYGYQLKRRDMHKANQYMRTSIRIAEGLKDSVILAAAYDNYGVLKEMENKLDSAIFYYTKSLAIKNAKKDIIGIPYSLNKLAGAALIKNDFNSALNYLKKSDEYRNKEEGDFGRAENISIYGDIYSKMNRIDSAIARFNNCLSLARKNGVSFLIIYSYENLAALHKKQNNFSMAYYALEKLSAYKDSIQTKEVKLSIADLELNYETEKKDHELAVKELRINEKNSQIYSLVISLVLLTVIGFSLYRKQMRKREKEKRELEFTNKLKQAELEKKIVDDKLHLSRELHDNIGSQLTFMISSIDNIVFSNDKDLDKDKLERLSSFGRETMKELRSTIWALNNEDSELKELVLKVNEFASNVNHNLTSLKILVEHDAELNIYLTAVQTLNVFRIIQEAIQNVIKHSQASQIKIQFKKAGSGFSLCIEDNGNGFDLEQVKRNNGLANMKRRCEEAGGSYNITSGQVGTKINCNFKLN